MQISWAMKQDAIHRPISGTDGWGQPIPDGPDVPVKVRWQFVQKLIRAANGQEEMCDAEVWAPLTITPKTGDRFVFEDKLFVVISAERPVSIYGETGFWQVFARSVGV